MSLRPAISRAARLSGRLIAGVAFFCFPRVAGAADTYLAPQFDLYATHNDYFRSHMTVSGNWLVSETRFSSAWAHYDLDIGVVPFFRRYLFKDPTPEKSKRISFRVGYLQVTDLKSDPNGFDEKRPLAEVVFRQPAGRAWLFENRNRGEYRIFGGEDTVRYRGRLRAERNVVIGKMKLTPYSTGEIFYDGDAARWNETQFALGLDIPWREKTIIELECMAQFVEGEFSSLSFAFVLQKFMVPSPSKRGA